MSVILLNPEIYESCHKTLCSDGYLVNGSANCLYNFLDWGCYDDNETTKLQDLFQELYNLNVKSWNNRYSDPAQAIYLNFDNGKILNIYQLLKYLESIHYQIEVEEDSNYNYLTEMIEAVKNRILEKIPEYVESSWSS